jgi:hypothetical protein
MTIEKQNPLDVDVDLMDGAIKLRGKKVIVDIPIMLRHFGLPDT